jgi:hypothetical protein
MERTAPPKEARTLQEGKHRFAQWRQSRPKGRSRIPADLWQTAVDLIGPYSVNEVARGLKLNHRELKSRHEAQHRPGGPPDATAFPRFVEFPCHLPASPVLDCVLEVEGPAGRKLKVTVRDERAGSDVLALAKGLWDLAT